MRTVNLKINSGGGLSPAHPGAKAGPDLLIYAIHNVPPEVSVQDCAHQVARLCLFHAHDDPAGWEYEWAELASLHHGAIINHYSSPH